MEQKLLETLKVVMKDRQERERYSGGEVFAWWGVLISLGMLTEALLAHSYAVYVSFMFVGLAGQMGYVRYLKRKENTNSYWGKQLNLLWIGIVLLLVVFPFFFILAVPLIPSANADPIISFILGAGLYGSGIMKNRRTLRLGGVWFLITGLILAIPQVREQDALRLTLNVGAMLFSFGLMGMLSNREKTRSD